VTCENGSKGKGEGTVANSFFQKSSSLCISPFLIALRVLIAKSVYLSAAGLSILPL